MKLYQRILICGAARQGNTLLMNLLGTGFRHVRILSGEQVPERGASRPGRMLVGKRPGSIVGIRQLVKEWDLGIIFTIRDPRDVVTSRHTDGEYWRRPGQWAERAGLVRQYREHPRAMVVRFERLIRQPEQVQEEIGQKFHLSPWRPFSECHQHFDGADAEGIHAMHGARPFDRSRIGHWCETDEKRRLVADALRETPDMEFWMREWKYDSA